MKKIILLLLVLVGPLRASPAQLIVTLEHIENRPGDLKLAVYQGKATWLQPQQAVMRKRIPLNGETRQVIHLPLAPGEYAISIVHDENDNERMDMKWLPYPHPGEGVGVSNNVQGLGPPSYSAAHFNFDHDGQSLTIRMRYYD